MRRLLLLVGGIVFVDTMFFAALTPLLPDYADEFDLSKAGAGILSAAYPIGALVGGIPGGVAAARIGARPTAIAGLLVVAVSTFVFAIGDTILVLDLARFAQGVGSAFAWTAGLTWLISETPSARRGQTIGTAMAAAIVGALFGPVLGGVAAVVGEAVAFGAAGIAAVGLGAWAAVTPGPPPEEPQPIRLLLTAMRSRRVAIGIWFVVLPGIFFGTLSVLAPLRLEELGFTAVAIGTLWLFTAGLEAIVNPWVGRISDRIGRFTPMRRSVFAGAVVTALLPWPGEAWLLAPLVVAGGIAFGSFWTPAMALLSDEAEQRGLEYAYVFALINLAWAPGQALGSSGGGALAYVTADAVPYLLIAAACLLTFAVLWRSRSSS
ncbi:MAG TPA: MFS transporter [Gaiellaceae bacterium]|nr:MFS transporter [Gaiellaceae bacterium]